MNEFTKKKEMRIALCKECNFDCFFCHSEGLDRTGREAVQPVEKILSLIERAIEVGFSDITFTGGEPLLRHKDIVTILDRIGRRNGNHPDITFVSNASFLPRPLIDSTKSYPGNIKFNVSLHSIDPEKFKEIVRVDTGIETVLGNIRELVAAGVKVKLNSVVLNGMNSGSGSIEAFLDRARKLEVTGVKFLELLVTPSNQNHYNYFYSDEAIRRDLLELGFSEQHSTLRTRLLSNHRYPDLTVEITRCSCKLGCANCSEHRDRQFDSQLRIHPCFVLSDKSFDTGEDKKTLIDVLKQVNSDIDRFAAIYGHDSPVLIPHEIYVESKKEVFFSSIKTSTECDIILSRFGYSPRKKRSFHLIFCLPAYPDKDWIECKKILKYGFDMHTPNKFEIIFSKEDHYIQDGILVSTTSYMSEKPEEITAYSIDEAKKYMEAFGYEVWFEKTFHIIDYMSHEKGVAISLDYSTTPINLKINYDAAVLKEVSMILKELGADAIMVPFPQWLKSRSESSIPFELN